MARIIGHGVPATCPEADAPWFAMMRALIAEAISSISTLQPLPSTPPFPSCLQDVAALQQQATLHRTPVAGGQMLWHRWAALGAAPSNASGGQPPLVLLHGGSGSWTHWVRNLHALRQAGRDIWVPDLPGFGDSSALPVGEDADALVEPLQAGLQALLGEAPCDVAGFSFGGLVAGLLAAQWPARVMRLVLVGVPGLGLAPLQPIVLRAWMLARDEARRLQAHRHNLAALMLWRAEAIDDLAVALHDANLARDRLVRRRLARTDVLLRALPQLACEVHGIYGEHDVLFAGQHAALAAALRQAPRWRGLTLVPEAGHWVQYENAAAFDAALGRAWHATEPPEARPAA